MIDYQEYLQDRVLIISGVGRSGTTILGKIVGSAKNTLYFFEPAIMKYLPALIWLNNKNRNDINQNDKLVDMFISTLFEDYILPAVQGRNININQKDWSYFGNYQTQEELCKRFKLNRRLDALRWMKLERPYIVIKTNEAQHLYHVFNDIFDAVKILHINRNKFEVIASMIKRGWFTDDYQSIDLLNISGIPLYVESKYRSNKRWFEKWNQETRIAYICGRLNKLAEDYAMIQDNIKSINYESLVNYPYGIINEIFTWCGLYRTSLTDKNIDSLTNHHSTELSIEQCNEIDCKIKFEDGNQND